MGERKGEAGFCFFPVPLKRKLIYIRVECCVMVGIGVIYGCKGY